MRARRGYRTELDLNNKQRMACLQHASTARFAYNWALSRKIEAYKAGLKVPTAIDLHRALNRLFTGIVTTIGLFDGNVLKYWVEYLNKDGEAGGRWFKAKCSISSGFLPVSTSCAIHCPISGLNLKPYTLTQKYFRRWPVERCR